MAESKMVADVTDQDFEKEVLAADKPTLVDFWADWCAPCRALAPVIDDLATTYANQINFKKMNVDENSMIPTQYGVRGIPTLILFRDRQVVDQLVGVAPKAQIEKLLQKTT